MRGSLGRFVPYVVVGGGQLRHLDADSVLMQKGGTAHLGGGAKIFLVSRVSGIVKGIGLRGEGRLQIDGRTLDLRRKARAGLSAGVSALVAF
jgi:hypothetical protein